jgi:glycerophosphoryl diester phosphodiesterase
MASRREKLEWLTARPIAHRGYHDLAHGRPENSLPAFAAAIAADYAIECDIHPSADGIPIVFHDDELERLTDGAGPIRDRSAAEIAELRLLATGEAPPTLAALLQLVQGRVPVVIELKHVSGRDAGLAAAVADELRRYDGPAALMSFDIGLIADIRAAAPHLPRGLTALGDLRYAVPHLAAMLHLGVDFISYSIDDLPTPAPILARRVLGIPLICWTVRTPEQLRKAKQWTDQITFEGFAA